MVLNSLYTNLIVKCVLATVTVMLVASGAFTFMIKKNFDENIEYQKGYVDRDILNIYFDKSFYLAGDDVNLRDQFYSRIRNKIQSSFPLVQTITIANEELEVVSTLTNTKLGDHEVLPIEPHLLSQCPNEDKTTSLGTSVYCIDLSYLFNEDTYNSPSLLTVNDSSAIERLSDTWQPIADEKYIFIQYKTSSYLNWLMSSPEIFAMIAVLSLGGVAIVVVYLQCNLIPQFKNFFEQTKQLTLGIKEFKSTNYKELDSLLEQLQRAIGDQEAIRRSTRDAAAASMIHDSKTFLLTILPTIESLLDLTNNQYKTITKEQADVLNKALLVIKLINQQTLDSDMVTRYTLLDKSSEAYLPLTHDNEASVPISEVIQRILQLVNFKNATSGMKVVVIPDIKMHSSYKVNEFFVRKCLQSLIFNSSKYSTPDDGNFDSKLIFLKIITRQGSTPGSDELVFQVIDQGLGVPVEIEDKIFNEKLTDVVFKTKSSSGLGVDLYYLNETAKETGDKLRYIKTDKPRGATFEYSIPQAIHNGFSEFTKPGVARVLIDLSDGVIRDHLVELTENAGYQIVQNNIFDFAVTDKESLVNSVENALYVNYASENLFNLKEKGHYLSSEQHLVLFDYLSVLSKVEPIAHQHLPAINLTARKGTVLLVDDTKEICSANKKMLQSLGFNVIDFNRSAEAIRCFETNPAGYDFYVLDFKLNDNDFSGGYLLSELHQITQNKNLPKKPAIALSAFPKDVITATDKEHGHLFDYYVTKNLIKEDLVSTISTLINDYGLDIRFDPQSISKKHYSQSISIVLELELIRDRLVSSFDNDNTNMLVNVLTDLKDLSYAMTLGYLTDEKIDSWIARIKNSGKIFNDFEYILNSIDEEIANSEEAAFQHQISNNESLNRDLFIPNYNLKEIDKSYLTALHKSLSNMVEENVFISAVSTAEIYSKVTCTTQDLIGISYESYLEAAEQAKNTAPKSLIEYHKKISVFLQTHDRPCLMCSEKLMVKELIDHIDDYLSDSTYKAEDLISYIESMSINLIVDITKDEVNMALLNQQLRSNVDHLVVTLRDVASYYLSPVNLEHSYHEHMPEKSASEVIISDYSAAQPQSYIEFESPPKPLKK
ncbi:hypothetical protein VA249_42420 (plasmid) [Vibrio alfacsensis]|nr:hypothetical protein VA249_42420 [Vibrio alfacsensis]